MLVEWVARTNVFGEVYPLETTFMMIRVSEMFELTIINNQVTL